MALIQRQIEILKKLVSNEEVSINQLLDSFVVSVNTLKNDIDKINDEINPSSHVFVNKQGKYYLDNKIPFIKDGYYLSDTLLFDNQRRFNAILGYLLKHQYTKLEDLELSLNLERSTFLPYLKLVRTELKKFDIDVLSKPKYGYYLVCSEQNYRYAYVFYLTLTKYPIDRTDEIYTKLVKEIKEKDLEINDTKFTQLYYYLKVVQKRNQEGFILPCENELYDVILEIMDLKENHQLINEATMQLKHSFECYLKGHHLLFLLDECHISLFDFLLKCKLKQEHKIYLNRVPNQLDSISRKSPLSLFLAKQLLDFIYNNDESCIYELANILYNEIVTRHYTYNKLRLLIVSTLDKNSHASLIYRLNNRYSYYIECIDSAYFYELSEELVHKYDGVIYFQKDGMLLPSYVKKKYALEYFINYNDFTELFEELIVPHFIYSNPFDFKHEIEKKTFSHVEELKEYPVEIYNQLGISILFTNLEPKTIYYKFDTTKKMNDTKIKEGFIFFLSTQDILSLKMAEHLIRLITQSKDAKEFLLQQQEDVYTKLLHQRKRFVE